MSGPFPAPVVPFVRLADVTVRTNWATPPRRLLDYLLFGVQEGRCLVGVDGVELVLIQPDTVHSLRGPDTTVTHFAHFDVFFNPRRTEGFATKGGQVSLAPYHHLLQPRINDLGWIDVPVKLSPPHPVQFQSTLARLVDLWREGDAISQLRADHLAMELILTIFNQHGRRAEPPGRRRRSLGWIPSYLSFHLGDPLSVADMAERARLSPSRFATVFREDFGLSPHQYFLRLRIDHARGLLLDTELPMNAIAEYCGFADVHHFSKAFKQRVQLSPGAYRRGQSLSGGKASSGGPNGGAR